MTGTEKQIAWAQDIEAQVMEAASKVYEAGMDKELGLSFEQTNVGHAVTFAMEHFTEAKTWIDAIGYEIVDFDKRSEAAKSMRDLQSIIVDGIESKIIYSADADLYYDEEEELRTVRHDALVASWAAKRAAKAAAKAAAMEN